MDKEAKKEIEKVEGILTEIRANTGLPWWRMIFNGALYGSGVVIGTVLAIAALGWVLSFFGVIPGFAQLAGQLQSIVNSKF